MKTTSLIPSAALILGFLAPSALAITSSKPGAQGCVVKPPVANDKTTAGIELVSKGHVMRVGPNGEIVCGEAPAKDVRKIAGPCTAAPVNEPNPGFATDLYEKLRKTDGNVFFSPYSISECIGMVYTGAGGNTANEIAKAMSYGGNGKLTAAEFKTLRAQLAASINKGENKLSIANALCVTGLAPQQDYQTLVREQYEGELFSGELPEINAWVSQKTDGKIDQILEKLSPDSACVLLNAVYFKSKWAMPFKAHRTQKAPFHVSSGKPQRVDMMANTSHYRMLRKDGLLAVELPYQTGASMVLILPDETKGMKGLEKSLNAAMLDGVCKELTATKRKFIDLQMPKFKIQTNYNLMGPMQELGMKDAFDFKKADFKTMYGESTVRISQIVHKATLEVNEHGSVASAATAVAMEQMAGPPKRPEVIRFDRPFLVLIRDHNSGTKLFMGRVSDPTS